MYRQTQVTPSTYYVDNFGSNVQALTFSYNGTVHSINRRGKRNIVAYIGSKGTYPITNGLDKYIRLNPYNVELISWTDVRGETHGNFNKM